MDTYSEFIDSNEDILKALPVPDVAHVYFREFLFYFYEFQVSRKGDEQGGLRDRPQLNSLYDVFVNILEDEVSMLALCGNVLGARFSHVRYS